MSHSSDQGEQEGAPCGRWAECEPGPSRCQPSRQGYCAYCRVLYINLEQHLSSLRHLGSVRTSSRGSAPDDNSGHSNLTLLERFLQDVLQHHPHSYSDSRPSHADLPSVSTPPLPRTELDKLCFSDKSLSQGSRELASTDDWRPMNWQEDRSHSQSAERVTKETIQERLSAPIRVLDIGTSPTGYALSQAQATSLPHRAPPSIHRKAHRKTNRRKSSSNFSSHTRGPGPPSHADQGHGSTPGTHTPKDLGPWQSCQRERREGLKYKSFSDHIDALDETIEEVIQMCCYGISTSIQQEETESLHLSLSLSIEDAQSNEWDLPVQVVLQQIQTEGHDIGGLMDVQVQLDDQEYSQYLDSALHSKARDSAPHDQGFWSLPIEEVLPAPAHIPQSFIGKSWAQIEREDEEKVDRLVGQFRRGRFICYFDSESLARSGRRNHNIKRQSQIKEAVSDSVVLPLLDTDDGDLAYERRRKKRSFRVASRCQVVKVSHSTQTVQLYIPAVRQSPPETSPTNVFAAGQDATVITPEMRPWSHLPATYSNIITPVQSRTSLVYLLCSPSGSTSTYTPSPSRAHKRCRKKRRPLDQQGVEVKYKRLPVKFYDPSTNRILRNLSKGFPWCQGPAPSGPPLPCIRQLFRSLSPELNMDPREGSVGSPRVRSHTSADNPFLLSTLSGVAVRRAGRTLSKTPPSRKRTEKGRGGRRERTHPQTSKRRTRAQASLPLIRREGLRRTGLSAGPLPHSLRPRRGRAHGRRIQETRRR